VKEVVGISAFGLHDRAERAGACFNELNFNLSTAVLPINSVGKILTGSEANQERTHTGLPWPLEARIPYEEPLRRVPISAVWRAMVEAGDRMSRWEAGSGISFSLARILAQHIGSLVTACSDKDSRPEGIIPEKESPMAVIAIPNNLDEFGQEMLLKEYRNATLVWRPVAAALSWLNRVESHFTRTGSLPDIGENDHIHVIYLGPDAIEFSTLRLRVRKHGDRDYIVPLRDRPIALPPLTGMDWAGRFIEERFPDIDEAAFWQVFIQFPEIWQTLAGLPWNTADLPRPWNLAEKWTIWNPSIDISEHLFNTKASSSTILRNILKNSCRLEEYNGSSGFIADVLSAEVNRLANLFPGGRLRGVIVCGPLAPRNIPPWIFQNMHLLASRGLKIDGNVSEPNIDHLWLCGGHDDPISNGAWIYGQRSLEGIPSYLDTMPQISILCQEKGRYIWIPLLNAQEVLGGEPHKEEIKGRFLLKAANRNLHVYLYKGDSSETFHESRKTLDPQSIPFDGITACEARFIREVVRQIGKDNDNRYVLLFEPKQLPYAINYAKMLYASESNEPVKTPESSSSEFSNYPLRRATFNFPMAPEKNTILDINVQIRPASGLARVEILPQANSFLQGNRVLLNYSTMRHEESLPRRTRGWPPIQEIVVDPEDRILLTTRWVEPFLTRRLVPDDTDVYFQTLNRLWNNVLKKNDKKTIDEIIVSMSTIDQNGRSCTSDGNEITKQIAQELEKDFQRLRFSQHYNIMGHIISQAGFLYKAIPSNIIECIRNILNQGSTHRLWNSAVKTAGLSFVNVDDFRLLFRSIVSHIQKDNYDNGLFTQQAGRSICRILMFRKNGQQGLDRSMAVLFSERAYDRLKHMENINNFSRVYFQMIELLLYLLRYRKSDPTCFDSDEPDSIFQKAIKSLEKAKIFMEEDLINLDEKFKSLKISNKPSHRVQSRMYKVQSIVKKIEDVIEKFDKYIHYQGTEEGIPALTNLTGNDLNDSN